MARGEMVRFMAERGIEDVEEIRRFDRLGYQFQEELSSDREYIFIRSVWGDFLISYEKNIDFGAA